MFKGDFTNFKNAMNMFLRALLIVFVATVVCGLVFSVLSDFNASAAEEFTSEALSLSLFTVGLCFVAVLAFGLIVLLFWMLFMQRGVLARFILCVLIVALVGIAVVQFTQTPYYLELCKWVQELIQKLTQGKSA